MVKAKDFWNHLCDKLEYRLFAGVSCSGLTPLYKAMNIDIMHYIPASNEGIALGIVSGGWLSGVKGGVLLSERSIIGLGNEIKMIKDFNIPMLFIVYSDIKRTYPFWHKDLSDDFETDLNKVSGRNKPSILSIKGGILE